MSQLTLQEQRQPWIPNIGHNHEGKQQISLFKKKPASFPKDIKVQSNQTLLYQRRASAKLVMTYRIIYGFIDIPASLSIAHQRPHAMLPDPLQVRCLPAFIFLSAVRLWNQLLESVVTAPTANTFRVGFTSQKYKAMYCFYSFFNLHFVRTSRSPCT